MIILLYGSNRYLIKEKLNEIVERYRQKHQGFNLTRFDAQEASFADFWQQIQQPSMFVEHRLTIIENLFQGEDFKKNFKKQIDRLNQGQEVVVAWSIVERTKKDDRELADRIKVDGQVQEFVKPSKNQTRIWLAKTIKEHQMDLPESLFGELVDYVGADWQRGQEAIRRLAAMNGQPEAISQLQYQDQTFQEVNIFQLTGAIARGAKKQALGLVHRFFYQGGRPERLLPVIVYQFRQLLIVRDLLERGSDYYQIRRAAGVPPFVFGQIYAQAEQSDRQQLADIYQQLFRLDYQIKTGRIDFRTGFDLFIARID